MELVSFFHRIVTDESLCVDGSLQSVVVTVQGLVVYGILLGRGSFCVEKLVGRFEMRALFLKKLYGLDLLCLREILTLLLFLLFSINVLRSQGLTVLSLYLNQNISLWPQIHIGYSFKVMADFLQVTYPV